MFLLLALAIILTGNLSCRDGSFFKPVHPWEIAMPAKSKAQQKAAGAALSAKRGDTPKNKLKGAARQMNDSMSERQLEELASTSRKDKPEHSAD
ncbi:MAG: hypothetical protein AMXMBFR76_06720 [Pseudomonadota bacterium]|jgi:hypothetical protein